MRPGPGSVLTPVRTAFSRCVGFPPGGPRSIGSPRLAPPKQRVSAAKARPTAFVLSRLRHTIYPGSTTLLSAPPVYISGCPWWVNVSPLSVSVVWPQGGEGIIKMSKLEVRWRSGDDFGIRNGTLAASHHAGLTLDDRLGVVGGMDTTLV